MELSTVLSIIYFGFLVVAAIIFLDLTGKAFNQSFLQGIICLLFPIGTYFYCRNIWRSNKLQPMAILVCSLAAVFFKLLELLAR